MRNKILLASPHMSEQGYEMEFVNEAFQTNWIAPLGKNVDEFEKELSNYVQIGYSAAVTSGTAAIHLALNLLDVKKDDLVFCSSFTFIASANPIMYQNAIPVFIDSEPDTWNMSPIALRKAFTYFQKKGILPKAVILVHLYGKNAKVDEILAICNEYNVPLIEDAAESLGTVYKGKFSGTSGKFGIYSFNGNKIITTSGGGMLCSNDNELIKKSRYLATQARDDAPYYQHSSVGYNYRMSNICAGIGRGQMKVLNERIDQKRAIFDRYKEGLKNIEGISFLEDSIDEKSNKWLTTITIDDKVNITIDEVISKLGEKGIESRFLWKPLHIQPIFEENTFFSHYDSGISVCETLFSMGMCLPSSTNMEIEDQNKVIESLKEIFNGVISI